jgi:hypothetical protein
MEYRPYFKHGIDELQSLVVSSRTDIEALKVIRHELDFRSKPKARVLKAEVEVLIRTLSASHESPKYQADPPPLRKPPRSATAPVQVSPSPTASDRLVVECAHCKTSNFVSTFEGVVQHLACSACHTPYEAQFKYGVLRTTFQTRPVTKPSPFPLAWVLLALAALGVAILLVGN